MGELTVVQVVGAARSGTNLLASQILGSLNDVCYVGEVRRVWRTLQRPFRFCDELDAEMLSPRRIEAVRRRLLRAVLCTDKSVLVEKTPGNCLRMAAVNRVFPDARVIHIVRDGRDVALSASREWSGEARGSSGARGIAETARLEMFRKVLADSVRAAWHVEQIRSPRIYAEECILAMQFCHRLLTGQGQCIWGPHFEGLRAIRRRHTLLETCALQWAECVQRARAALDQLQLRGKKVLEVKFEELIVNPRQTLDVIRAFLSDCVQDHEKLLELAEQVEALDVPRWRRVSGAQVIEIEALVGDVLETFGYELSES